MNELEGGSKLSGLTCCYLGNSIWRKEVVSKATILRVKVSRDISVSEERSYEPHRQDSIPGGNEDFSPRHLYAASLGSTCDTLSHLPNRYQELIFRGGGVGGGKSSRRYTAHRVSKATSPAQA
jgi:hypothetical protein